MKKRWLYGVVLLSLTVLLGACGHANSKKAADKDGVTNLSWYIGGAPQKDMKKVNDELNKYLKDKYKLTVDITQIDMGNYDQKMNAIMNSGEHIDLMFTSVMAFDYMQNARKGLFKPMTEYLNSGKYNKLKEAVGDQALKAATIDGEIYGIPGARGGTITNNQFFIFNKKYIDKYDIPYKDLKTYKDLEPWLKLIKEKENFTPWFLDRQLRPTFSFDELVKPLGINLDGDTTKIVSRYETPQFQEKMKTIRDYVKKGYINDNALLVEDFSDVKSTNGKWFMTSTIMTPLSNPSIEKDLKMPVVSTSASETIVGNYNIAGVLVAIGAQSKHPSEAMKLIDIVNNDKKVTQLLMTGIEGEHYTITKDGLKHATDKAENYAVQDYTLGTTSKDLLVSDLAMPNYKEVLKEYNDQVIYSPAIGFNFDNSKVVTQLAAINNTVDEYEATLNTGSVDFDKKMSEFNKKLKAAGIDKVKAEMQTQYDTWLKENK